MIFTNVLYLFLNNKSSHFTDFSTHRKNRRLVFGNTSTCPRITVPLIQGLGPVNRKPCRSFVFSPQKKDGFVAFVCSFFVGAFIYWGKLEICTKFLHFEGLVVCSNSSFWRIGGVCSNFFIFWGSHLSWGIFQTLVVTYTPPGKAAVSCASLASGFGLGNKQIVIIMLIVIILNLA